MNIQPIEGYVSNLAPSASAKGQSATPAARGRQPTEQKAAPSTFTDVEDKVAVNADVRRATSTEIAEAKASVSAEVRQNVEQAAEERIRQAIEDLSGRFTSVQFFLDRDHDELVVNVVGRKSGEVVRQIPPDEVLRLREQLAEMRGMLFSETS